MQRRRGADLDSWRELKRMENGGETRLDEFNTSLRTEWRHHHHQNHCRRGAGDGGGESGDGGGEDGDDEDDDGDDDIHSSLRILD